MGPEAFGERRTIDALIAFLETLGSADRPAVIVLDDCQWADDLTLKLLAIWQRRVRTNAASAFVSVLIAYRTEDVPPDHPLRTLAPPLELRLAPFVAEDVRRLVESMAGSAPRGGRGRRVSLVGRESVHGVRRVARVCRVRRPRAAA